MSRSRAGRLGTRVVTLIVLTLGAIGSAAGHEIRPAYLQVTERTNNHYDILWKQPVMGLMAVHLIPHISGGLLDPLPSSTQTTPNFRILTWIDLDGDHQGLEGRALQIEGLDQTITDVLVSITLLNGDSIQEILHPKDPSLIFHLHRTGIAVWAYLTLGIAHILSGVDHLSFVLGLMLLVRSRITLVKTITAFTVAHSITLAATALHLMTVRPAVIEALVAFSIIFVAVEVVHRYRGKIGLTTRYPWLIAFTFGLLHGAAFAGALAEIGLPPHAIVLSLLLFNLGVELGQLMFIATVLLFSWLLLSQLPKKGTIWVRWIPPYAIGSFAAFWFFARLSIALS